MAKKPPPTYVIPPLPPKPQGKSNTELIREARAGTITWSDALRGVIANGYSAKAAGDIISTAQKTAPKTTTPYTGPTASAILTQARRTKDWDAARAALLRIPNYSPARADVEIGNAQADIAKKGVVSQGTVTKTLSPASTPADQAKAAAALVKTGNFTPDEAAQVVHQYVTPKPDVPPLDWVLKSLQVGTITRDQARVYFGQMGISPKLQTQYLATAHATEDKWAVLGTDGRIKFTAVTSEATPPSNVLKYGAIPMKQSDFMSTWTGTYKDVFYVYSGRQASGKEIAQILKAGVTPYTLATGFAQNKSVSQILGNKGAATPAVNFKNAPIYKQHAPGIVEYIKSKLGQNWKVDTGLVASAIAQSWDSATLDAHIRAQKAYTAGPEFKDSASKMSAVYQQIYGTPNQAAAQTINQATLAGWTPDEFASYLRAQPSYTKSPEFLSKILTFGQSMGLITGQQPGLVTGGSANAAPVANPNQPTTQTVPNDPRLAPPTQVQSPLNLVPKGPNG